MDLTDYIILISTLITSIGVIVGAVTKIVKKLIKKINEPLEKKQAKDSELSCKRWLVDFLSDVENGTPKNEVQYEYAYEVYDYYTNTLHKNSYIHDYWERVIKHNERKL